MSTVNLTVKVVSVKPGYIRGQYIGLGEFSGGTMIFDVIENLYRVREGEVLEIQLSEEKPANLDEQDFCAHGYLVAEEEKVGETVLSLWGIIFRFKPPLGLKPERKYYLCFKKKS